VLDEATANLDFATEAEVKKTVNEIRKQHTVIVIAHRYSMVRDADHVIVLSAGGVMEQGTPDELIAKGGWFYHFATAADGQESQPNNINEKTDDQDIEEDEVEESEEDETLEH
jgi:ABC-type multidrug transport system fused ATPase/permease subunit